MDHTRIVLVVCCLLTLAWHAETTFPRKPILNYLVRYHLGKLRSAKSHLGLHHPHEEHYHHYYVEPFPYGAVPLHPPIILPDGHTEYSHFSLNTPHYGQDFTKYHHSFNLPHLPLQHEINQKFF